ncbi:MAG: hypothetical protein JRN21_09915 [Nitrososphaerota archaeon]|nr:hypothetical protein [Nitrososphaerota archaeon]
MDKIIDDLETRATPLALPNKLHSSMMRSYNAQYDYSMLVCVLEAEAKLRQWSISWIVDGASIYDKTNGRIGSVEGKKVARYLESRAAESTGAEKDMYLQQARLIEDAAETLYRDREQIHVSSPL